MCYHWIGWQAEERGKIYGKGCKTTGEEKCFGYRDGSVSGESGGGGLLSEGKLRMMDRPGKKDS